MEPAEFLRANLHAPLPELLPWQKQVYEGKSLKPARLVMGGGRAFGRRLAMVAAIAEALRTGETVSVCASSEAQAERPMVEARRLLRV
jgi:hypothetical protein